jgi:2-polyprenyl-6-hydroxyphenyl methylase/3-demethylubiquinone-9 3-methyltransferase
VECTKELKRRYYPDDPLWAIEEGSIIDRTYLSSLGQFDVVYSWGVLHHTAAMWEALANVAPIVSKNGRLFIAIYNDQGRWSRQWKILKRVYNQLPRFLRLPYTIIVMGPRELRFFAHNTLKGKPWGYFEHILHYSEHSLRGMSYWHDLVDWIGGYPFEVAKPEEIFNFYRERGFQLLRLKTCGGGLGCNEFVFQKA